MLIPSDTAKPLNSFLNSGFTLKLSDSFSLSAAVLTPLLSLRLLAKVVPLGATTIATDHANQCRGIQISAFLAIPKARNRRIPKARNKEFWIEPSAYA